MNATTMLERSLRFLILTQYFPPEQGAAQIRLRSLASGLLRRGHDVKVVTAMPNYPHGHVFLAYRGKRWMNEEIDGIKVTRTWIYAATGRNPLKRLLNYWSFSASSFFACLGGPRPDYVFVESPPVFLACTAYVVARLRRARLVLNVADLWPETAQALGIVSSRWLLWLGERMARFLYRHADFITTQTDGLRAAIERMSGRRRVIMYYNGIDAKAVRRVPGASTQLVGPEEIAFVFAGILGYAQGLDTILEAASLMRERRDVVFLIVGDGPYRASLIEKARGLQLANVRFVDMQPFESMPVLLSSCRASIAAMRKSDIFKATRPAKIFAAMACETPVIFSGEGEAATLLTENRCGVVVPPESPAELAAAVTKLADDPALAVELGRRGRALVEREFDWNRIVDAWLTQLTTTPTEGYGEPVREI